MNTLKFNSVKSFQEFLQANPEVSGKVVLEVSVPLEEVKKTVVTFPSLDEYNNYLGNNPSFTGTAIVLHRSGIRYFEIEVVVTAPETHSCCTKSTEAYQNQEQPSVGCCQTNQNQSWWLVGQINEKES